nr:hypothetical protein CFP56_18406 [Quercus suber]
MIVASYNFFAGTEIPKSFKFNHQSSGNSIPFRRWYTSNFLTSANSIHYRFSVHDSQSKEQSPLGISAKEIQSGYILSTMVPLSALSQIPTPRISPALVMFW